MDKITVPGIYRGFDPTTYYLDPCETPSLTQSLAKALLEQSPAHAWLEHPRNPAFTPSAQGYAKERAIGNAWHLLMLERGKQLRVIHADNFNKKAAQELRDATYAAGEEPILAKHFQTAVEMAKVAKSRLEVEFDIKLEPNRGDSEVVIAWQEQGHWFRSLIDFMSTDQRLIVDLKSGMLSCAPHSIPFKMQSDGFHVQSGFHERGLDMVDPENAGRRQHLFVMQENCPPYEMSVIRMNESVMTIGRKMVANAIERWKVCRTLDEYPGYPALIHEPELPSYAVDRWLRREEEEFAAAHL